jgi:hypothetical protein
MECLYNTFWYQAVKVNHYNKQETPTNKNLVNIQSKFVLEMFALRSSFLLG